jgi:DNA-3-methyladenine glycosylase I
MNKQRCGWCDGSGLYTLYHDTEWGVPIKDDRILFEFLVLESFQAGLSWITILKKREHFRKAFDDFDFAKIAEYNEAKIAVLLQDTSIVRNRLKIRAAVTNARAFMALQETFGTFSHYLWAFVDHKPIQNNYGHYKEAPTSTPISDALCKDLKKKGFLFMGPTVVYAFMQAIGMVNDHETTCFRHKELMNP